MNSSIDSILQVEYIPNLANGIINLSYNFGAANNEFPIGTAHFLEHVVCSLRAKDIKSPLRAETRRDVTSYYMNLLKDDLYSTISSFEKKLNIDQETVERERSIIVREIAQFQLNKRNRLLEYLQNVLFAGQGYGNSILGTSDSIKNISQKELQNALKSYRTPSSIVAIGPWTREEVVEAIYATNLIKENTCNKTSDNFIGKLGNGIKTIPEELQSECIAAGAWMVPRVGGIDQRHITLLHNIWQGRIKKYLSQTGLNVRINLYKSIGMMTLDSNRLSYKEADFSTYLSLLNEPVSKKEFNNAFLKLHIEEQRRLEDLQSRTQLVLTQGKSNTLTSEIRLVDILKYQNEVAERLNKSNGVYIFSPNDNLETYKVYKPQFNQDKNLSVFNNYDHGTTKSKQYKGEGNPILKIYSSEDASYYNTIVSSALTSRFHLVFRVDGSMIGRLLLPLDIPKELLKKGVLEYIRYEGWHSIIHLSFFTLESLKEAIFISSSLDWCNIEIRESDLIQYFNSNLETEMKYKILESFKPIHILMKRPNLIGKSVIIPNQEAGTQVAKELEFKLSYTTTPQFLAYTNNEIKIIKKVVATRFSGVAVIGKLSEFSLSALALQEAAFGSSNIFPTLEHMVRKEGYSYRIVQSLITVDNQPCIYWGIQCTPKDRRKFRVLVVNWLNKILQYEKIVEEWFLTQWSPFHPQNHRSVFQLIREVDRMGYYAQAEFSKNINIRGCVESLLNESLEEILFEQVSS